MKLNLSNSPALFQLALMVVVYAACGLCTPNTPNTPNPPNTNTGQLASGSWPQLRGAQHGHAAPGIKLASEWSERKNVTWKTKIPGLGWSSPVISDGEIWLTTSIDKPKSLRAICIDQSTGEIRQNIEVFKPKKWLEKHQRNSHATPTPILDADKVFVHFGSYGTAAIERDSGNFVWKNDDLVIDHQWGPGSSPVLHEDLLICNCDGRDVRYVIALDKSTGKTVWKTDRSVPITKGPFFRKSFSTPSMATIDGKPVLLSAGANQFSVISPNDGTEQWNHEYFGYAGVAVPVIGNGMVFVASGYGDISLTAFQLDDNGKQKSGQVAWTAKRNVPIIPTPIVVESELYMVSDDGIFSCLDCKSGKVHWRKRLKGGYASSITFGDNKLFVSNDKGATTVVEPSKKKCTILATNQLDGNIQATPAIADNSLFIRTQHSLYRISTSDDG